MVNNFNQISFLHRQIIFSLYSARATKVYSKKLQQAFKKINSLNFAIFVPVKLSYIEVRVYIYIYIYIYIYTLSSSAQNRWIQMSYHFNTSGLGKTLSYNKLKQMRLISLR